MAAAKVKRVLQEELHTQEEWERLLERPGMVVVDAYSAWCGPCTAIRSLLNKIKINLDRDDLMFATAETDSIGALSAYRGKSQPTFLFYGGGVLANVVRGCDAPMVNKAIKKLIRDEGKVAEGLLDRTEFVDTVVALKDEEEKVDAMKDDVVEHVEPVVYGVVLLKPHVVDVEDDITTAITGAGFEVGSHFMRLLISFIVLYLH